MSLTTDRNPEIRSQDEVPTITQHAKPKLHIIKSFWI
uniref:Uncharacterized protein n=1 Tax=Rhizophora mucronata TaxID=61149 RepID=A0A2P2PCG9_RHIMU